MTPKTRWGITTSAEKLNSGAQLISQKKYKEASATLNPLKDWLVDATEAHIGIYKTLKSIPSAQIQAELEKQLAPPVCPFAGQGPSSNWACWP